MNVLSQKWIVPKYNWKVSSGVKGTQLKRKQISKWAKRKNEVLHNWNIYVYKNPAVCLHPFTKGSVKMCWAQVCRLRMFTCWPACSRYLFTWSVSLPSGFASGCISESVALWKHGFRLFLHMNHGDGCFMCFFSFHCCRAVTKHSLCVCVSGCCWYKTLHTQETVSLQIKVCPLKSWHVWSCL